MQPSSRLRPYFLLFSLLPGLIALGGCSTTQESATPDETAATLQEAHRAYNAKQYKKVFQLLFPLAAAGNDKAQYTLGYLFHNGLGVEKNDRQAMHWLQRAAAQGNKKALQALSLNNK
ncbi:MAG: SEL1-like repeat protein [Candidatus Thiodiazotropha sp. (ex Dulcina madagascariensis)]|nr:SEL1-like repeat protein [Candidatus Thiodiazotropha sp. (ex Epidulcina cf. delphinae)]MCU7922354.1 SEL1-like repeat protein [Candidatus Thiodiazotropha sp. (ex Dulcina madagascariensis)]MCU7925307.1 SEL1-like repeat protein [Candidatus Thiodiazotropha sp. (ex Dulcina madagascariensis)]